MKIELYISQLLYRHQCVTVPGFGAFLTEIQSAKMNESTNSFSPPKKLISFNSLLKNNDGLLANHISKAEKINYESAVSSIESEVAIWKNSLEVNEKFSLKSIGELMLNSEKKLVFTPSDSVNYLPESFGLISFVSPSIKRVVESNDTLSEIIIEKEPIVLHATKESKEIEPIELKNGRPYLRYAAVLILGLSVTTSVAYKIHQNYIARETLLVETAVQKQVQNKIQEATFFIENPISSVTLAVKEQKLSYHVVAGAFRNEENAQNAYNELLNLGFKARRIAPNTHKLFPVLYGSYATYAEAQQAMGEIHQTLNSDAWLMIKEL